MKILMSSILALFLLGCSGENKDAAQQSTTAQKQSVTQNVQDVKSEAIQAANEIKEKAALKAQEVQESVATTAEEVKEEVALKVQESKEAVVEKVQEVQEALSAPQIDAAKIYSACAGCHGADGSKVALGKSQVIKGWDVQKTANALNGYKTGTYGGAMKGIMVGQVSKLGDAEIQALSEHISKL